MKGLQHFVKSGPHGGPAAETPRCHCVSGDLSGSLPAPRLRLKRDLSERKVDRAARSCFCVRRFHAEAL